MAQYPDYAERARQRHLQQEGIELNEAEDQPVRPRKASFWKRINWWYLIACLTVLAAVGWLFVNPPDFQPNLQSIRFSGHGTASLTIGFLEIAFFASILFGFVEASDRKDPLRIDWWLPFLVWGFMIYAEVTGLTIGKGVIIGFGLGTLALATFWNRGEEYEEKWWERFDTTGVFNLCFALVLTHLAKWQSLPYPTFVPLTLVYIIGAFALLKEMLRSFLFAILVLLLGVAAGFYLTWTAILITFALTIAAVYAGAWQQKIPVTGRRRNWSQQSFGGFQYKLIKAWDVMFAWWAAFILTATYFYGNFPLIILIS